MIRHTKVDTGRKIQEMLVPTMDTARTMYLLDLCIKHHRPVLFCGPTGTGKSVYVQEQLMNNLPRESYSPSFLAFSAQTSANQTQMIIMSKLDKRRKGYFGPPIGKKAVIFIDDVNMPAKEIYGAQPPIELLRMYFDHGYWFELKEMTKLVLEDILLVAAMGPPGGSRQSLTPRFLRHFNIISTPPFNDETMNRIFSTLYSTYLRVKISVFLSL